MAGQEEVLRTVHELLRAQGKGAITMSLVAERLGIDLHDDAENERLTQQLQSLANRGEIIFSTVLGPAGGVILPPDR